MAPRIFIFSIVLGVEYLSYVKSIATFALTFLGYIISVLASVLTIYSTVFWMFVFTGKELGIDCRVVAWQGAAIIAGSNTQRDKWMDKAEYTEHGAEYINTKVLAATDFS